MCLRQLNNLKWQVFLALTMLLHIFAIPTAWADPDVVAQNYAAAQAPNIQSNTSGYNLLAGDVGYSKTQIQGALPYTLSYRGVLRGNMSAAQVMESQENSTSGWTDNYQGYVTTINFGYQITNYTLASPTYTGGSPYPYNLTSSANPTTTTQMSIYFVQLPGESVIAAFKDETTNGTTTFTRLYSADPEGDIQTASSGGAGVDSLPWSNNLGEYTFVRSGNTINISKNGVAYTVASNINTITSQPAYTNSTYVYYNSAGNGVLQANNPTAPAGSLSNAAIYQAVAASAQTTTFQRVTGIKYPSGKQLTLAYDTNNNLTQVSDNRNNVLTFQHTFKANPAASTQTLNESRVITQVSLKSGTVGDIQTAVFTWTSYNVLEPATGNSVAVFALASSSSPIAGTYTYTNQLVSIGATYPYISNQAYYQTAKRNNTAQPLTAYVFPILKQVTNSASQVEQQWNITQNYLVTLNSTTGLYYNSTAKTTLEALHPGNGSANALDMTAIYDDVAKTITMSYSPDGTQTATTTVTTVVNGSGDVTINVSGAPILTIGGKPIASAEFNTTTSRLLNFTDAKAAKAVYTYDNLSRVLSVVEASGTPLSRTTSYIYTTLSTGTANTTQIPNTVNAPWLTVTNTINARGQITQQVTSYPGSSSSTPKTWLYYYYETTTLPNYGLPYYTKGPSLNAGGVNDQVSWTYDNFGNIATYNRNVNNSSGAVVNRQTSYANYNSAGQPQTINYPDATKDTLTYDASYQVLSNVHSRSTASTTTSKTYDSLKRVITSTDEDGKVTTYSYDGVGRPSIVTDPSGNKTTTTYFPNNTPSVVTQSNPQGVTVAGTWNTLDANGRRYTTRQGSTTNRLWVALTYDANGNTTQTRTALGIINSWTYDALNRVVSHTDGNGKVDTKGYDTADNNTTETAANSAGSTRGFINHDELQSETNNDFGLKTYTLDPDKRLTARGHADRSCSFGIVDQDNRPKMTVCTSNANTATNLQVNDSYIYDTTAYGNLDSVTSNNAGIGVTTNYTYDLFHRLLTKTQVNQAPTTYGYATSQQKNSYTYTAAGKLATMTMPSGKVLTYGYDTNGVISSIKLGATTIACYINYDGANRLRGWTWGVGGVFIVGIDDGGLTTGVTNTNTTGAKNFNANFLYDLDGRITRSTVDTSNVYKYTYDNNSQLLTESLPNASTIQYTYDTNGNRLTLSTTGTTGLAYTAANYSYTGNRLTGWTKNTVAQPLGTSTQGEITNSYIGTSTYDNAGRRKLEGAVPGNSLYTGMLFDYNHNNERTFRRGSNLDRQYAYDESSHLIGEYTGDGALIVEYIWLGDRPIAAVYGNRIVYIVTDHQNKPRRAIDASTQQVVWSWDPDAFGVVQPATGLTNGVEMNLRFPGQYYDIQTGLYYNLNRYYNPELGRYMEPDPIGLEGGLNPYSYVANNPINMVDPSGLSMEPMNDAAMRGAIGAPDFNLMNFSVNSAINSFQNRINNGSTYSPIGTGTVLAPRSNNSPSSTNLLAATYQAGFSLSGIAAMGIGVGGNIAGGIASDNKGNYSLYGSYGGGLAAGTPSLELGVQAAASNGRTVNDLSGTSYNVSMGGGLGPHISADGFTGTSGDNTTVIGGGSSLGVGFGGGSVTGASKTYISPSINILNIINYVKRK